jgi:hypothetical protein
MFLEDRKHTSYVPTTFTDQHGIFELFRCRSESKTPQFFVRPLELLLDLL